MNPADCKPAPTPAPRRWVRQNVWGNWQGYLGRKWVREFGRDHRAAWDWQAGEGPDLSPGFDRKAMAREVAEVVRQRRAMGEGREP